MKKSTYQMVGLFLVLLVVPLVLLAKPGGSQLDSVDLSQHSQLPKDMDTVQDAVPMTMRYQVTAVMVELEAEPAGVVYARMLANPSPNSVAAATQTQLATIRTAQAATMNAIRQLDSTAVELYRVQKAYNGIALQIDASHLSAIAAIPGVKAIHPLVPQELDHTTSVPLLGAPEVWNSLGYDLTGDGISIGVIDTGIDYHHTMFAGPGSGYGSNDTTILEPAFDAYFGPVAVKVMGGYDFAGDDYNANDPNNDVPSPDPDPLDCNGHGTHVAGTAAGFGVNSNGSTYTGGYDSVPFSSLRIGPGMAPEAELYALRVFGCDGSTTLTTQAIDWAMDPNGDDDFSDHLDIINMSLGSGYGRATDPTSAASEVAAMAGVVVVAAAGNAGDTYYIIDSPSVSGRTISVAGSVDASAVVDGFDVNTGALAGTHPASKGVAFDWTGFTAITGTLTYPADQATGCDPFSGSNQALITGTIVLLNWTEGECGSSTRGDNLEDAGAIGMLLADDSELFDLSIFGSDLMPSYSIPFEVGDALSTTLGSEGTIEVTLTSAYDNAIVYSQPQFTDNVYTSSSRGPRSDDSYLKPDITAVAVSVFSAAVLTGDEGASFNGTSMATPHVAGLMALLRQQHPTWTVEELKALAMNTATYDIFTGTNRSGDIYGPGRTGAGRISAPNSAVSEVIAYNATGGDEGLVSVSFGQVDVVTGTTTMITKTISVVNKGTGSVTYEVLYEPRVETAGVDYQLSTAMLTVPGSSSASIDVTLVADSTAMMRAGRDATVPSTDTDIGLPRYWLGEAAGYVMLLPETSVFTADLSGDNEIPPTASTVTATATMTYSLGSTFDYVIEFSDIITVTAAHIHLGTEDANGGIVVNLNASGTYDPGTPLVGTSNTLTDTDVIQQLFTRGTYVNVHSPTYPGGEIRGQVIAEESYLRLPVHSAPTVVSDMSADQTDFDFGFAVTGTETITLTGTGIDAADLTSFVTAFELQLTDPTGDATEDRNDIQYVGVHSDISVAGTITDTTIYFGVANAGDWTVPWFYGYLEVWIDTDEDGFTDYVLWTNDLGRDVFVVQYIDLNASITFPATFINGQDATIDMYPYNSNVMVLPIDAALIGLGPDDTTFNYLVASATPFFYDDFTAEASYDAAAPGIDFTGSLLGPIYADLDGETIPFDFARSPFFVNGSQGILLLHHHNGDGARPEVITVTMNPYEMIFPLVFKQ